MEYLVLCFFVILIVYAILHKLWGAGIFIVVMYALSAFCSILLLENDSTLYRPTLIPSVLYCFLLYLTFAPFLKKGPEIVGFKSRATEKRFVKVAYMLSIAVVVGMLIILPTVQTVLDYGLVEARAASYAGEQIDTSNYNFITKVGFLLVGYFGILYPLYIVMFFYSLVFIRGKSLLKVLLIIASLSQIEVGLKVGARNNATYWLLSLAFTFIMFYPYLSKKIRIYTLTLSSIPSAVVTFYFIYMTVQRSVLRAEGTNNFLLDYAGQSYLNFCYFFDSIYWHPYTFERLFPFVSRILGNSFNLENYRLLIENRTGMVIGIFYTFMGDIFVDIGLVGLILFVLFYYRTSFNLLKKKYLSIDGLCYLCFLYAIPLHGLFYYSMWQYGDIYLIFLIIIANYISRGFASRSAVLQTN